MKIITSSGKPDTTMADKFIDNRTYVRYTIFIATIGFKSRQTVQWKIKKITNGQFDIPFWLASCGRRKDMQEVHVACPCCKNKRLFDADPETVEGIIKIKCPICRSVIAVSFHKKKVRTERIGV